MTRCLVIFPPQWSPFSPHLAPVSIASNIRKYGNKCDIFDLNIEFYREVLTKNFLNDVIVKAVKGMPNLKEELKHIFKEGKNSGDYSIEEQIKIKKLLLLNEICSNKLDATKQIIDNIANAIQLLNDKEAFYNLKLASNSISTINKALEIVSIEEFPQEFSLYDFKNNYVKLDYKHIKEYCCRDNIFSRFYKEKAVSIVKNKYDYIGISISSSSQLFSALILSKMLKERVRKTKICLGGNYISRIVDALKNNLEFFKIFTDFVIYEEGERASVELLEYIQGKRKIEDVSSLIYFDKKTNEVEINKQKEPIPLSKLAIAEPKDFPLDKYFLPEIIMPVQLTRGCYWKKCTFCDHYFGQTYNVKDIDNLIKELRILKTKYGINNFEFTDDCISPNYLKQFSERLIEERLDINWYCDLRLEDALTQEILDIAYKAGLKMVLWGYETGSKRVMELINKGIDIDKRFDILKRATKAGIYNFVYIFMGFPTETYDEAMKTINDVCDNPDIIHSFGTSNFSLGKHSLINSVPQKFGITKLEDDEEFSAEIKYTMENGLNKESLIELDEILTRKSLEKGKNPAWMFLFYRELLFLYIVKYGRDNVLNMKY